MPRRYNGESSSSGGAGDRRNDRTHRDNQDRGNERNQEAFRRELYRPPRGSRTPHGSGDDRRRAIYYTEPTSDSHESDTRRRAIYYTEPTSDSHESDTRRQAMYDIDQTSQNDAGNRSSGSDSALQQDLQALYVDPELLDQYTPPNAIPREGQGPQRDELTYERHEVYDSSDPRGQPYDMALSAFENNPYANFHAALVSSQ